MAQNEYKPITFNGEALTTNKLNQLANNSQFLFDRTPRVRYASGNLVRDNAVKVLAGKTAFPVKKTADWANINVYFGNFFTAGSHPIVTVTPEVTGAWMRKFAVVKGFNGEIDHTGFLCQIICQESIPGNGWIEAGGWVHWQAVGY